MMSKGHTWGRGLIISAVPIVFFLGAAVAGLAGWLDGALIGVGLGFVAVGLVAIWTRRGRSAHVVALDPDEAARVRQELDQNGETAAVRGLRQQHPGLSLGDAVKLVRNL